MVHSNETLSEKVDALHVQVDQLQELVHDLLKVLTEPLVEAIEE